MKNLLFAIVIAVLAWLAYGKFKPMVDTGAYEPASASSAAQSHSSAANESGPAKFACDERTHCSQMRSCAEAIYFIKHCPNTKMDGNEDGVPCEKQWCN
ncbi:Excalibur calcium-binding domain-containing protein [Pseudoxanthomonas sp. CF125]|nr:Excalibur calcium-binding domain-containing protein [Pseudoxanthomonas sp. CF125]